MRVALLVPVKALNGAKSRLADVLGERERRVLAWMLLKHVLRAAGQVSGVSRRVVVTSYEPAMRLAGRLGWEVLPEAEQVSESASVDRASEHLERDGVDAVLRLPLDLPLLTSADVERIVAMGRAGVQGVLVPSRSGDGTNAVWRAPPTLFASRFGPGSLRLHEEALRKVAASYTILPLHGLGLDIDDAADLVALMREAPDSAAARFLRRAGVDAARLPGSE